MRRSVRWWPWLVIGAALACCLPVLAARTASEQAVRTVELVMDLGECEQLARWWGQDVTRVLGDLKSRGLTSVGIPEITLERLQRQGKVTVVTGAEVLARARTSPDGGVLQELAPLVISAGYSYVVCDDEELAAELERRAVRRPAAEFRRSWSLGSGRQVLEFGGSHDALGQVGLGFDPQDLELARELGLWAVPRPRHYPDMTAQDISELVSSFGKGTNLVIMHGSSAIGYPGYQSLFGQELKSAGFLPGLVEAPSQRGYVMLRGMDGLYGQDYQFVRVFSVNQFDLDRVDMDEVSDQLLRAATERNIRALYLRPLVGRRYQGIELAATHELVSRLNEGLSRVGLVPGPAGPFPHVPVSLLAVLAAIAAAAAAVVLVLRRLVPVGFVGWVGLTAVGAGWLCVDPLSVRLATALAVAALFPVLAVLAAGRVAEAGPRRPLARAVSALAAAAVISVTGGALLTAVLGDSSFMLEVQYLRGVKLSYILPVVILAVVLVRGQEPTVREWLRRLGTQVRGLLGRELLMRDLLALAVLAGVGFMYLGRAGHESGLEVSGAEVMLRGILQRLLDVRPRFKEFLIGHPALLIGVFSQARGALRQSWFWQLVAVTGQVSIVNSFAHLRTPLLVSLERTGHGLWLGAAVGLLTIGAVVWIARRTEGGRG